MLALHLGGFGKSPYKCIEMGQITEESASRPVLMKEILRKEILNEARQLWKTETMSAL
jgi:hypothetical protein